jgi:hypothetical protein
MTRLRQRSRIFLDERTGACLAPWVVAAAPIVAAMLAGRSGRRQLLIVATSVTAIGWLVIFVAAARGCGGTSTTRWSSARQRE